MVIRGKGDVFCSGLDMAERRATAETGEASGMRTCCGPSNSARCRSSRWCRATRSPAATNWRCIAIWWWPASKARFGMSLAQVGLAPNWFLAKKLMEVLGPVTTREMLLLGDPLPAARLYALGLIARCVPPDGLEAEAARVVERLAANAPLSMKAMKALTVRQMEFRDGIPHGDVDALVRAALSSEDAREGMLARLEKRAAKFQGR